MSNMTPLERASLADSVYNSQGWCMVFQPLLEDKRRTMMMALRDPSLARKAKLPDDFIRGVLDTVEWIMATPRINAEVDRNVAVEDELQAQRDKAIEAQAALGYGSGEILDVW